MQSRIHSSKPLLLAARALEYSFTHRSTQSPRNRRPWWPCREVISGVVYDYQESSQVCAAAGESGDYYVTNDGHFFLARRGQPVQPCTVDEVVEAMIGYHISARHWPAFAKYMPALRK